MRRLELCKLHTRNMNPSDTDVTMAAASMLDIYGVMLMLLSMSIGMISGGVLAYAVPSDLYDSSADPFPNCRRASI